MTTHRTTKEKAVGRTASSTHSNNDTANFMGRIDTVQTLSNFGSIT